ncbi:hypothetical protein M408DRAFT_326691 [Serendipita vermifera MAFF 305830]|uniref:Protein HGH1 homolog n=1 Tax=Serendipita vermifera MAFF 305830 TaxID=933852 RepID=A0A0C2XVW9_SERVB|nr:hypothetical protein M408DRAFT_326691 [Serendipita vermifera MAFF 305830]
MALNQYKEILPFLHDRNPNARTVALTNLLPLTAANSPLRSLFFSGVSSGGLKGYSEPEVIRDLKLLCRDQPATAHDAFKALVNLSDSALLAPSISEPIFLGFLVSYIYHWDSLLSDLACMLLSNATCQPATCRALIGLDVEVIPTTMDGASPTLYASQSRCPTSPPPNPLPNGVARKERALSLLVNAFSESPTPGTKRKGQLHFLATVFANISGQREGREFLLSPHRPIATTEDKGSEVALASLIPFTEHPDTIRRGGIVSTIKNCAFIQEAHKMMLSSEKETFPLSFVDKPVPGLDILPRILLPLAGPEEFELEDIDLLLPELQFLPDTKIREKDPILRATHLESLILLCTTRWGRETQRKSGVYEIVKMMHESEADDTVLNLIDRLVNLLKRDEDPNEQAESKDSGAVLGGNESDEDEKIVEI